MPLALETLSACSVPGHRVNEDIYGATATAAWVMDGASTEETDTTGGGSAAARYVADLNACLLELSKGDASRTAVELLSAGIARAGDPLRTSTSGTDAPTAAAGVLTVANDRVTLLLTGDVVAIWRPHDTGGCHVFYDRNAYEREQHYTSTLRSLMDNGVALGNARRQVYEEERQRRRNDVNRSAGSLRVSGDPRVVRFSTTMEIAAEPGDVLLLASDGFARCVEMFGLYDWPKLLTRVVDERTRLEGIVDELRAVEREDTSCSLAPRMSVTDDATALCLLVTR